MGQGGNSEKLKSFYFKIKYFSFGRSPNLVFLELCFIAYSFQWQIFGLNLTIKKYFLRLL